MGQDRLDLLYPCNTCFADRGKPCLGDDGKARWEVHGVRRDPLGKQEAHLTHELCTRYGYGRIMQLASDLWGKLLKDQGIDSGGRLTVGTCAALLVQCVCLDAEEEFPPSCGWCCGTGTVTKAVRKLIENPPIKRFIRGHGDMWNPLEDDDRSDPLQKWDAAMLINLVFGFKRGAVVAIYLPKPDPTICQGCGCQLDKNVGGLEKHSDGCPNLPS